jgi:DNA-binding transcriptional MerR regulator
MTTVSGTVVGHSTDFDASLDFERARSRTVTRMTETLLTTPAPAAEAECATHPAVEAARDDAAGLTIAEVAERTGVGAHTLRYYDRIGLVDPGRDDAGRRIYGPAEVGRVVFISYLRAAGMPIADLQTYFGLVRAGDGNEVERLAILERHRDHIERSLDEMRTALELIELKIELYRRADS